MAAFIESGTITGTGATASVQGKKVGIDLDFSGTATVVVQWSRDGNTWTDLADGSFTADGQKIYEGPSIHLRLNCTAYTNDVTWWMQTFA